MSEIYPGSRLDTEAVLSMTDVALVAYQRKLYGMLEMRGEPYRTTPATTPASGWRRNGPLNAK